MFLNGITKGLLGKHKKQGFHSSIITNVYIKKSAVTNLVAADFNFILKSY